MGDPGKPHTPTKKAAAIVFGDIVAYSSVVSHVGDLHASSLVNQLTHRTSQFAKDHNVLIIKYVGDGFVAIFDQTTEAVAFAMELQQSLHRNPIRAGAGNLHARIAIHFDTVLLTDTEYGEEILGTGINLAARLQAHARPGGVVVSDPAFRTLSPDSAARFTESQQVILKGFAGTTIVWSATPNP